MNRRYVAAFAVCVPLAIGCAFLAWRIFTLGAADHWAIAAPARALSWRSNAPDALDQAAEDQFAAGHLLPAQRLAKLAIAAYPLDGTGYRVLARIADRTGDGRRALQLFRIAAIRSSRDASVHATLADDALKAGDIDAALRQFDLLMQLAPSTQPDVLPRLVALAESPAVDPALIRMLAKQPPWRGQFLWTLAGQGRDPATVARIFRALQAAGSTALSVQERQYWIGRQIGDHDWSSAHAQWASTVPVAQRSALGNLFDGNFEFAADGNGFGWRITPVAGAEVRTAALPAGGTGNALTIEFTGMRTPATGIAQLLALTPGHYLLHGRAQAIDLDSERGLQWALLCAEGQQQTLMTTPALTGNQPWRAFATPFEVPEQQCGGQWLRLEVAPPYRIGGRAAYANLGVDRIPAAAAPNPP